MRCHDRLFRCESDDTKPIVKGRLPEDISNGSRKIGLVVFDLDGAIYDLPPFEEQSCKVGASTWNVLFARIGIPDEHERLKQQFISGSFPSYMEWTNAACEVLKEFGLKRNIFQGVIETRELSSGVSETIRKLRASGIRVGSICGSFEELSQRARRLLSLDFAEAHCELQFDDDYLLSHWKLRSCDYQDKPRVLQQMAEDSGLQPDQCAYVGHEVNDIDALRASGLGIAFNATKRSVIDAAHLQITKVDSLVDIFACTKNSSDHIHS